MSLKQKTVQGLKWSTVAQIGKQGSQFIIVVILARLLSPDDFGLLGMASVFTGFAMIFSELGMSAALIQKQDVTQEHLSSAFWLNLGIGLLLALVFALAAPLIAWFYGKPQLRSMILVMSINFILTSLTVVQQTILQKEMNFKPLMIRDICAVMGGGVIGIACAFNGFGVWSLVYQLLGFTAINGVLLWTFSPWRPAFVFSASHLRSIFGFSAYVTGFNVLNYFSRNVDHLLIGKFLGAEILGYYTLAYKLMLFPLQNISWVISRVMFPAFSRIQNDLEKVRGVYFKMTRAISLVTFPMMTAFSLIAPEFVLAVYGPKWQPAVLFLQIFCFCGMIQSLGTTVGNLYLSQGRAGLQLKMQLWGTAVVILSVFAGLPWGALGVASAYTLQSFVWTLITIFVAGGLVSFGGKELMRSLWPAVCFGLLMGIGGIFLRKMMAPHDLLTSFLVVLMAVALYVALLFSARLLFFKERKIVFGFLESP